MFLIFVGGVEELVEDGLRIVFCGEGDALAVPGDGGERLAPEAGAAFDGELEGREAGVCTVQFGCELVGGNALLCAGFDGGGERVGAVVSTPFLEPGAGENGEVVAVCFEGFEDAGEFRTGAESFGVELAHVHAGAEVKGAHAGNDLRGRSGAGPVWHHRFEEGKREAGAGAAEKGAAVERGAGLDIHRMGLLYFWRNCGLATRLLMSD